MADSNPVVSRGERSWALVVGGLLIVAGAAIGFWKFAPVAKSRGVAAAPDGQRPIEDESEEFAGTLGGAAGAPPATPLSLELAAAGRVPEGAAENRRADGGTEDSVHEEGAMIGGFDDESGSGEVQMGPAGPPSGPSTKALRKDLVAYMESAGPAQGSAQASIESFVSSLRQAHGLEFLHDLECKGAICRSDLVFHDLEQLETLREIDTPEDVPLAYTVQLVNRDEARIRVYSGAPGASFDDVLATHR